MLISCYVTYEDGDRDAEYQSWVTALMAKYQHLSEGTQCSDENFGARFFQPLTKENMEKLERLRDRHDPSTCSTGSPTRPDCGPGGGKVRIGAIPCLSSTQIVQSQLRWRGSGGAEVMFPLSSESWGRQRPAGRDGAGATERGEGPLGVHPVQVVTGGEPRRGGGSDAA